jgi:2-polyprenyl-3-methyl-5-hydroxy-6-metoxy-1,4-benzoquinol methylase
VRSSADRADFDFLLASARAGRALDLDDFTHLDQPIGIWNYIRIANDIVRQLPSGHVLDWGCGFGQMTYLLRRRGLEVTAFDLGEPEGGVMPDIPVCQGLEVVRTGHPTQLPLSDGTFQAVLSCGVLEHVDEFSQPGNEEISLREIGRVMRPGGRLFIYQLPQRHAWQEALARRLRRGYCHPRRFTAEEISRMLRDAGYSVTRVRRANMLPKNLTGMPAAVRKMYSRFSAPLLAVDAALCKVPVLRALAGVLEITAVRQGDDRAASSSAAA